MPSLQPDTNVIALVLAGGEGKRLAPLTLDRAKPAVPFGGNYRLIDFALSNLVNAGYRRIAVLTQYKSLSLDRHITRIWRLSNLVGDYVATVPAQMRRGPYWFAGSADAIFQNLNLLRDERPEQVIVFGADHVYRMDPSQMVAEHIQSGAGVTVAAIRVPIDQANQFGVIETEPDGCTIAAFREKPEQAAGLSDAPHQVYASMGNYVFDARRLIEVVSEDAEDPSSAHDIGANIIPRLVASGEAQVYDFARNLIPGATERDAGYWRDVGTIDAFYDANMDLISVTPIFNLYNMDWPILTLPEPLPPAKFVFSENERMGHALDSMVSPGVIVSGATIDHSVISTRVHLHSQSLVTDSVVFSGVDVGRGAVVRRAIIDKDVVIEPGARIGVDPEDDQARFTVSPAGIVVVPKGARVTAREA